MPILLLLWTTIPWLQQIIFASCINSKVFFSSPRPNFTLHIVNLWLLWFVLIFTSDRWLFGCVSMLTNHKPLSDSINTVSEAQLPHKVSYKIGDFRHPPFYIGIPLRIKICLKSSQGTPRFYAVFILNTGYDLITGYYFC